MNWLNFVLCVFAGIGLSHILADASIVAPLKIWLGRTGWFGQKIVEMMNCYQCNGWWSGLAIYLISLASPYLDFLLWAFAISLVSLFVGYIQLYLSLLTSVEEEPHEQA